jgi:dCTP deaminase
LGKTYETIELPIREEDPYYAARVEGRSSYARCGLLVHFTAPTIHCGFKGSITLEMMNFGKYSIMLYPKMSICQLIIESVDQMPFRNDSQFQGQITADGLTEPTATTTPSSN